MFERERSTGARTTQTSAVVDCAGRWFSGVSHPGRLLEHTWYGLLRVSGKGAKARSSPTLSCVREQPQLRYEPRGIEF